MKKILSTIGVIVFLFPKLISGQVAPDLHSAAGYALFTGSGEFTSLSTSTIVTGNVGNLVGVVTAFPPGLLTGAKHFGDGNSIQVNNEITAAYADLAGRTCGLGHVVGFGGGEILAPGVYCSTAASTLNGTLILDAANNPAAIFIIKIDGAFSAASGSQVLLSNQASACNVYWQINGAVDLNNSAFIGTMLINGAVSLNTGTSLQGRALTKTGALIFDNINATICDLSLLPLHLSSFDVSRIVGNNVQLSWLTTSEVNMSRYEIESSVNAISFIKAGTVISKGNSFPTQYSFTDADLNKTGVRFYRLKMIDINNAFSYSPVKSVKFTDPGFGFINISPNPAVNAINISIYAESQENIILTITNMNGQKIRQRNVILSKGLNTITEDIHTLLKAGYFIGIKNLVTGKTSSMNFQKL